MKKTGIFLRETDETQPYRVWYEGKIIWFAHDKEEAELKLKEAKERISGKGELAWKNMK